MINCGYVWICCRLDSGNIPRRHTTLWSDRMSTGTLSPRHLKYCANNKGFNSSIGAADLVSNRARQSSLWYTCANYSVCELKSSVDDNVHLLIRKNKKWLPWQLKSTPQEAQCNVNHVDKILSATFIQQQPVKHRLVRIIIIMSTSAIDHRFSLHFP